MFLFFRVIVFLGQGVLESSLFRVWVQVLQVAHFEASSCSIYEKKLFSKSFAISLH